MCVTRSVDSSVDEHHQILRQSQRFLTAVRHENSGRMKRVHDPWQFVDEARVDAFVEPGERFVEEHQRCAKTKRSGQAHASSLAAGKTIGPAVEKVRYAQEMYGLFNAQLSLGLVHTAKPQSEFEIAANRLSKEHVFLEHVREMLPLHSRRPADTDPSRSEWLEARNEAKQCGLARSIGTEDCRRPPTAYRESVHLQREAAVALNADSLEGHACHGRARC